MESEVGDPQRGGPGHGWTARAGLEGSAVSASWASVVWEQVTLDLPYQ